MRYDQYLSIAIGAIHSAFDFVSNMGYQNIRTCWGSHYGANSFQSRRMLHGGWKCILYQWGYWYELGHPKVIPNIASMIWPSHWWESNVLIMTKIIGPMKAKS